MTKVISVQIVGAPIACESGVKDSWRETAKWAEGQLKARFGEAVEVHYYDLFDPGCPAMPQDAQLPLVLVEGEVLSSGGKISIPVIRRRIEELMEKEAA
jgi:disulfide oxidoreductase YuzD